MSVTATREIVKLPYWRCFKMVKAAKILSMHWVHADSVMGPPYLGKPTGAILHTTAGPIRVDAAFITSQVPDVGGYYVEDQRGPAFVPAETFENGDFEQVTGLEDA